jgi:hypothetical protein
MSESDVAAQEKVLSLLKLSFPQAFLASRPDQEAWLDLPADAIVLEDDNDLRLNLLLFGSEDLSEILPPVLADLLTTEDRSGIEAVVSTLNVSLESDEAFQQTKAYFGSEIAEKEIAENLHKGSKELYLYKLDAFGIFNQHQAIAIHEWLHLVSEWPELEDSSDEVKSAIQYWMRRAKIKTS